ncbi:MAG: HD domain-containing protein [Candidatus Gastranaerophilaceae bacterium]
MKAIDPIVHGIEHVDRVRKWAIKIGKIEKSVDMFILEVTALLHDIGRAYEKEMGLNHWEAGRIVAKKYLESLNFFSKNEIDAISQTVYEHGPGGASNLTKIVQDADRMDLWGAIGVARAFSHRHCLPFYKDKDCFKYRHLSQKEIDAIFQKQNFQCVLDDLNISLNIYESVNTKTAKKFAREKIEFQKMFIKQLKKETIDL